MELEQLRQLDAIEREGTMSAAARALHLSQPALSRSVQRLEDELGTPLFSREGRRAVLNEAGRAAVDWARQILRDERLMRDAIDSAVRRARSLRVGTVAPAPLWRLTGLMVEAFPRETLTSQTVGDATVVRGVVDGTYDLGIVREEPDNPLLRSCELMREDLAVTLPPNLRSLRARPFPWPSLTEAPSSFSRALGSGASSWSARFRTPPSLSRTIAWSSISSPVPRRTAPS